MATRLIQERRRLYVEFEKFYLALMERIEINENVEISTTFKIKEVKTNEQ